MRTKNRWLRPILLLLLLSGCPGVGTLSEICDNSQDDDEDSLADCQDQDCAEAPGCQPSEEICDNGLDDDADGDIDCADFGCVLASSCTETCDNGLDDDADGALDCADSDCVGDLACREICDNGLDDDADGLIDCADLGCTGQLGCNGALCSSDLDCASGFCLSEAGSGFPAGYCSADCGSEGDFCPGGGVCFDAGLGTGAICLDPCNFANGTEGDCREAYTCIDLAFEDPFLGACLPGCTSDDQCPGGFCVTDPALPGVGVCGSDEDCLDGIDNDRDGGVDCADPDCISEPLCL